MKIRMKFSDEMVKINGVDSIMPCPFCGSSDNLCVTSKANFIDCFKVNGSATISMKCENCNLELYEHDYHGKGYLTKVRILVSRWNTRKESLDGDKED